MSPYTTEQILEKLKKLTGDRLHAELAFRLGVSKQSCSQYKHKKLIDIQQKIISLLLDKLAACQDDAPIEAAQGTNTTCPCCQKTTPHRP